MLTTKQLGAAPALALVLSFVLVITFNLLVGFVLAPAHVPLPIPTEEDHPADTAPEIGWEVDGDLIHVSLDALHARMKFGKNSIAATVTQGDERDKLEVCLVLPAGKKIGGSAGWSESSEPDDRSPCTVVRRGTHLEFDLVPVSS